MKTLNKELKFLKNFYKTKKPNVIFTTQSNDVKGKITPLFYEG